MLSNNAARTLIALKTIHGALVADRSVQGMNILQLQEGKLSPVALLTLHSRGQVETKGQNKGQPFIKAPSQLARFWEECPEQELSTSLA